MSLQENNIGDLILKYLNKESTEKEALIVFEWIRASEDNKLNFIKLKKAWALTTLYIDKEGNFKGTAKESVKKAKRFMFLKYAAILMALISIGKFLFFNNNDNIYIPSSIVLELGNGQTKYLKEMHHDTIFDSHGIVIGVQMENEIIYNGKTTNTELVFNTLKVPHGKTYKLTLSDGTVIHLNSGTSLKYPEKFGENQTREVFLSGEALFEVSKNKELPFIVHSNKVDIEVIGTIFNVNAYENESIMHCELVEGSVRLLESSNPINKIILNPNTMAIWNFKEKRFDTKEVDVNNYISWIKGVLIFNDESFTSISKKLERSYNVQIINNNETLANQHFTGSINLKGSRVENLFDLFKIDTPFEYSKNGSKIEIIDGSK